MQRLSICASTILRFSGPNRIAISASLKLMRSVSLYVWLVIDGDTLLFSSSLIIIGISSLLSVNVPMSKFPSPTECSSKLLPYIIWHWYCILILNVINSPTFTQNEWIVLKRTIKCCWSGCCFNASTSFESIATVIDISLKNRHWFCFSGAYKINLLK